MALPLTALLKQIEEKAEALTERNRSLYARIDSLEEENNRLRRELQESKDELEVSRRDVEFLTMSHRLADTPDSVISARRHIARLIRNIDNCISMLKEE